MPKHRQRQYLKHWIVDTILSNSESTKANSVKVLKHLSGPNQDGSIVREVTDGSVFIRAVFSNEALEEMFSDEGSSQPEWFSALLILKKYTVCFDARNCLERSEFIIKVTSASVWDLQQGFYLKYRVTDCMDNQQIRDLAKEAFENYQQVQSRSDSMDCSIPLTQLLENMTEVESQESQCTEDTGLQKALRVEDFIIPPQQHVLLESIQEWKSDYVPSLEDFSQTSPLKSSNDVEKDEAESKSYQKEFIKYFQKCEQKTEKPGEIACSGESIKLSCSDNSGDETNVNDHGDGYHDKIVVTSSSEDSNEMESSQKGDNSTKIIPNSEKSKSEKTKTKTTSYNKDISVSDGSVSSTVNIHETQPFSPAISPTQGFMSEGFDPFLSPLSRKSSSSSSHSLVKKGIESISSDQSLIGDTPEDDAIKTVKLGSNSKVSKYGKFQTNKDTTDNDEDKRLLSLSNNSTLGECDHEEYSRLNRLTSSSEDNSAEHLLRKLDKPSSSLSDHANTVERNQSQSSSQIYISDSTLMAISSGQIKTAISSHSINVDKSRVCIANDNGCDLDTQDLNGSVYTRNISAKRNRTDSGESPEPVSKVRRLGKVTSKKRESDLIRSDNSDGINSFSDSVTKQTVSSNYSTLELSKKSGIEKLSVLRKSSERLANKRNKFKSSTEKTSEEKEKGTDLLEFDESQSLLDTCAQDVLRLPLVAPDMTEKKRESVEVILISSGELENQLPSQTTVNTNTPEEKQVNSGKNLENRQRRLCTQSDITSTGMADITSPDMASDSEKSKKSTGNAKTFPQHTKTSHVETVAQQSSTSQPETAQLKSPKSQPKAPKSQPKSPKSQPKPPKSQPKSPKSQPKCSLLEQFISEIQPVTEIGKRLMALSIPDDLAMSAYTYYKDSG